MGGESGVRDEGAKEIEIRERKLKIMHTGRGEEGKGMKNQGRGVQSPCGSQSLRTWRIRTLSKV